MAIMGILPNIPTVNRWPQTSISTPTGGSPSLHRCINIIIIVIINESSDPVLLPFCNAAWISQQKLCLP